MSVSSEDSPISGAYAKRSMSEDFDLMMPPSSSSHMSSLDIVPLSRDVSTTSYDSSLQLSASPVPSEQQQQQQRQSEISARRPRSRELSDAIHPQKYSMKTARRNKTAVGAVGGAVIGTLVMPVVGTAVGAAIGGYTTNKIHKTGERRAQRRWEQASFQATARQSAVVNAEFV